MSDPNPNEQFEDASREENFTEEERALIKKLVADGLAIQHKFRPEPLYKTTGKGHYESDTVEEIRQARELSRPRRNAGSLSRHLLPFVTNSRKKRNTTHD